MSKGKTRSEGLDPELRKVLGNNLRQARKVSGYTQEHVAEQLDVSLSTVWQWEDGRVAPMLDRLTKLADLYGVSVDWLLARAEPPADIYEEASQTLGTIARRLPPEDIQQITDYIHFIRERREKYKTRKAPPVGGSPQN